MEAKNQERYNIRYLLEDLVKFICDFPFYTYLFFSTIFESIGAYFVPRASKSLEKERILVTGAATGLGRAVVLNIAKKYKPILVLWDIKEVELQKTAKECDKLGAKTYFYVVDLSNRQAVMQTAEKVRKDVGYVTILYNNAGIVYSSPFCESNAVMEEKVLQVNLFSYMWTIKEFLPDMIERGSGHLVSTCSAMAFLRFRNVTSYAASKYGLRGFIDSLKLEMRERSKKANIKFSTVYPGWMQTPMTSELLNWEPRYRSGILMQMDCEYVAEKVVNGIVHDVEEIIIPQFLRVFILAYWFLPTRFFDRMEQFLYKDIKFVDSKSTTKSVKAKTYDSKDQYCEISGEKMILVTNNSNSD